MNRCIIIVLFILYIHEKGLTQISLTSGIDYTQDFEMYQGTAVSVPIGWSNSSTGSAVYRGAGTGSGNAGGYYAYYSSLDTAFGNLTSNTTGNISHCVEFENNTGREITSFEISYDFKQYRYGGSNSNGFTVTGTGALAAYSLSDLDQNAASIGTNGIVSVTPKSLLLSGIRISPGNDFGICWTHLNGSGSDNGIAIDNFSLADIILPVKLSSFQVYTRDFGNSLEWITESEVGTSHFIVERGSETNFDAFEELGVSAAAGSEDGSRVYQFLDASPLSGFNYYRLKIVDLDGSYEYSPVRSIYSQPIADLDLYPSLVLDRVEIRTSVQDRFRFQIYNLAGYLLVDLPDHSSSFIDLSHLNPGIIVIRATGPSIRKDFRVIKL